jgi:hypothetical protein
MYVTFLTTRALESHNILAHLEDARLTLATQVVDDRAPPPRPARRRRRCQQN